MNLILHDLHTGALYIFPFVILLGLLIFVHELGHFLVAKACGVRVEVFSLGFGRKILQYKRGDTNYCVSMIPVGGYVKMFGDEPNATIPDELKSVSFTHKPLYQRFFVVLAGPTMNFVFAIVLFSLMAFVGEQKMQPVLGDVPIHSAAYQAGFRPGERILSINGHRIQSWEEVTSMVRSHAGDQLQFKLASPNEKAQTSEINVTPARVKNSVVLSTRHYVGSIDGLSYLSQAATVGISDPKSPAGLAGLRTGDLIENVDNQKIGNWRDLQAAVTKAVHAGANEIHIKLSRSELLGNSSAKPKELNIVLPIPPSVAETVSTSVLTKFGIESSDLYLGEVFKNSPAKSAGLRAGDRILSINDETITNWNQVIQTVKTFKRGDKPLAIGILRDGEKQTINVAPKRKSHMTAQGQEVDRFMLGIVPQLDQVVAPPVVIRTTAPLAVLARGWHLTVKWTDLTIMGFIRLIQNRVSPRNLGGIISIGQIATRSFEIGLSAFLSIMAVISINLFIVNLLPVPVLDGGHLLFYTLEAIRGKPLSMKYLEVAQQVGLLLLVSLMIFSLFNDFSRIFHVGW